MTTSGDGPFKLRILAADKERTYYETVVIDHWKDAKFVHIKPTGPISQEDIHELAQGFMDHTADRSDRPVIMVGDYFDVEIYVLEEDSDDTTG